MDKSDALHNNGVITLIFGLTGTNIHRVLLGNNVFRADYCLLQSCIRSETMIAETEERRMRGIAKQIGLLKCEIRKEKRKNTLFFLSGVAAGLILNIIFGLLVF